MNMNERELVKAIQQGAQAEKAMVRDYEDTIIACAIDTGLDKEMPIEDALEYGKEQLIEIIRRLPVPADSTVKLSTFIIQNLRNQLKKKKYELIAKREGISINQAVENYSKK